MFDDSFNMRLLSAVAMLASAGGTCSIEDQARIASTLIQPKNVVSYLIVEDTRRKTTTLGHESEENGATTLQIDEDAEMVSDEDQELFFNLLRQGLLQDDSISVAVLRVGRKSFDSLLTVAATESQTERENGGTKITMNSKVPNQTLRSFLGWALISLALCCCSCFCLSMFYQHGTFTVETETRAPPRRPVCRRLTVAQVREKFPSYRFYAGNGPIEEGLENDEEEGLGTDSDLCECSICLDDFAPGQRVRQLPCGHIFHSTCIARWLVERNAVCPLCKLDVFEEEEEESSSSSEEEEAQADPLISETVTREEELVDQAVAESSGSRWWSFSSSSSGSAAPGTRWAMRWLSLQRRRGNGDGGMQTEMTMPLLSADRSEAVEVIDFQSPDNANATTSEEAAERVEPEEAQSESQETPSESSSNEDGEASTSPVEV